MTCNNAWSSHVGSVPYRATRTLKIVMMVTNRPGSHWLGGMCSSEGTESGSKSAYIDRESNSS